MNLDDDDWLWQEDSYAQEGSASGNRVNVEIASAFPLKLQVRQNEDGAFVLKEKPWTEPQVPHDLEWIEGPLPLVETVPDKHTVLAWMVHDFTQEEYDSLNRLNRYELPPINELNGTFSRTTTAAPWGDKLNPRRWCDSLPIGYCERVAWYAWIYKGKQNADSST